MRHLTVTDPDNPFGCPAFDGPAFDAGDLLDPGTYVGHDSDGDPVTLTVYPDRTAAAKEGVTCRFCREAVTPSGSGDLENSEGRLACPAQPDSYHEAAPVDGVLVLEEWRPPAELLTGQLLVPLAQDEQLELGT